MKCAVSTVAYREARFMPKFLDHLPGWIEEVVVLVSEQPWFGPELPDDGTAAIARDKGATVIEYAWESEQAQRNAGQEYLSNYDWVIVLDPDEFLDDDNWDRLRRFLDMTVDAFTDAWVVDHQLTYWKNGYVADPPRDYKQLIAVRPNVRFVDKRVVDTHFDIAPVFIHHFSWARTDQEVYDKITHYAHAKDFDVEQWYREVWLKWQPGIKDVHPTTPETLHKLIPAKLPPELEIELWPI